jgi:hypothetical protein
MIECLIDAVLASPRVRDGAGLIVIGASSARDTKDFDQAGMTANRQLRLWICSEFG